MSEIIVIFSMIMYGGAECKQDDMVLRHDFATCNRSTGLFMTGGSLESQFKRAEGLEQFARQSFELLCWIEARVVWPLVISPSLLVGFLSIVLMRRGRSSGF